MYLVLISFLAGVLSILTPCSFTILPVVLSSSLGEFKNKLRPFILIISLALSVFTFSLLLKATTLFIELPLQIWSVISGLLIIIVALSLLYPEEINQITRKLSFSTKSERLLNTKSKEQSIVSAILSGAALGPIFTGCSPTYLLIISVLLPAEPLLGIIYLASFCSGLAFILLLVVFGGRSLLQKLKWAINPNGRFRKYLGVVLLLIGTLIFLGIYKEIEASLLNTSFARMLVELENNLLGK